MSIDPQCMQDFEEQRYAIARPFGATAYMPRMLAAMLSNVRVVSAKELLEGGAYADYEKMCSIDPYFCYEVLMPFSVTLADGEKVVWKAACCAPTSGVRRASTKNARFSYRNRVHHRARRGVASVL